MYTGRGWVNCSEDTIQLNQQAVYTSNTGENWALDTFRRAKRGGRTAGKGGKRGGGLLEREGKEGGGLLEGWENKIVGGKKQIKSLHSLNYTHSYIPFTLLYILYYYILHMYTKTTCNNVKFPIKM